MKRTMRYILAGAVTLLATTSASAADYRIFDAQADFSADIIMTIQQHGTDQKQVIKGKVYVTKDGMERREFHRRGRTFIVLNNRKTGESHTLMPEMKMYMVNSDKGPDDPRQMVRDGKMTITRKGSANMNGFDTDRYTINSVDNAEEKFDGDAWITKKHNIPVRFVATSSSGPMSHDVQMDWRNHDIRKQPRHLFEIPSGWEPMHTGSRITAPPGSGQTDIKLPPGMTKDQIEKIKKQIMKQQGG